MPTTWRFCLELIDDTSNAALEYRNASSLLKDWTIDDETGHFLTTPPRKRRRTRRS